MVTRDERYVRLPLIAVWVAILLPTVWRPECALAQSTASYAFEFNATWSAVTHPDSFPPNPHFSPLIGGTHNDSVVFWEPGGLATHGIERMAEGGSRTELRAEVELAIDAGTAGTVLTASGLNTSPGTSVNVFELSEDYPLVTLVSMLAPSPDWFVGVHGLNMREGGEWKDSVVVDLYVYDAGTDSGQQYNAANQDTDPAEPIALLTSWPFDQTGLVGQFRFKQRTTELDATVLLEGPYNAATNGMNSDLGGSLPTAQPFSDPSFDGLPIEYDGLDSVSSMPSGAVDWVLVELRSGLTAGTLVGGGRRPAILMNTGVVTGLDGGRLIFDDVIPGSFHIVVRHRNHVPIISADPFDFAAGPVVADFTDSLAVYSDSGAGLTELETGIWGLAAADGDLDGAVSIDDFALWLVAAKAASTGYLAADFDLDATAKIDDFALFLRNAKAAFDSQVPE